MASILCVLDRIKQDLRPFLPDAMIVSAAKQAGHRWRTRKFGPVETIHLFIVQVLNFNTAMTHLRHLSKKAVKAPAYCRARMRLPLGVLQALLLQSSEAMRKTCSSAEGLWCGLRPYLVDGSSTIAPDTPDSQKAFGQPKGCKKGCGFPVPKLLGLFDAFSGLMVQVLGFPLYTHEASKVWMLHPMLGGGNGDGRRFLGGGNGGSRRFSGTRFQRFFRVCLVFPAHASPEAPSSVRSTDRFHKGGPRQCFAGWRPLPARTAADSPSLSNARTRIGTFSCASSRQR
jgi:hypothetical protein